MGFTQSGGSFSAATQHNSITYGSGDHPLVLHPITPSASFTPSIRLRISKGYASPRQVDVARAPSRETSYILRWTTSQFEQCSTPQNCSRSTCPAMCASLPQTSIRERNRHEISFLPSIEMSSHASSGKMSMSRSTMNKAKDEDLNGPSPEICLGHYCSGVATTLVAGPSSTHANLRTFELVCLLKSCGGDLTLNSTGIMGWTTSTHTIQTHRRRLWHRFSALSWIFLRRIWKLVDAAILDLDDRSLGQEWTASVLVAALDGVCRRDENVSPPHLSGDQPISSVDVEISLYYSLIG